MDHLEAGPGNIIDDVAAAREAAQHLLDLGHRDIAVIRGDPTHASSVARTKVGVSWVRTPPLSAVFASAPYLHNGSVPTLRALFEPPARRPATFPLGTVGFVFDTRTAGNHNGGHEFGTKLTPAEKDDLVAYLQTL